MMNLGAMHAVWQSLTVATLATALALPAALATAWVLTRTQWRGRTVLRGLTLLPLVMPPVVTGYLLLMVFSPKRFLGAALESLGFPVAFHWLGAVVAAAVVGFPLLVMLVSEAFRSVDVRLEKMSEALGRSPWQTFWRVTMPLAWPGVAAGAVLAFARSLGEFGATIVLAGHVVGETETIPLAVHAALDVPGAEHLVWWLTGASVLLGVGAVLLYQRLSDGHRRRLELDS
ncbi:MAG: molybdate transport system permease protein [Pseudohongiellaceae bacterium]|jgi:molybdate transport system permease protein